MKLITGLLFGAAAAAAAIWCADAIRRNQQEGQSEVPLLRIPNPFVPSTLEIFDEKLGFRAEAPKGAEHIVYSVLSEKIANVDFDYAQYHFTLRAAETDEDVSGLYGQVLTPEVVDDNHQAVMESVLTGGISRRLKWYLNGIYYTLINTDGADASLLRRIYREISGMNAV